MELIKDFYVEVNGPSRNNKNLVRKKYEAIKSNVNGVRKSISLIAQLFSVLNQNSWIDNCDKQKRELNEKSKGEISSWY